MTAYLALDIQNVFFNAKKLKKRLNFQKVYDLFSDDVDSLNAYVATSPHTETSYLIGTLQSIGFNVKTQEQEKERRHLKFNNRSVSIVIDIITEIDNYDSFILISMDEGLTDLIRFLQDAGKKVIIWSLDENQLSSVTDNFHTFEDEYYLKK